MAVASSSCHSYIGVDVGGTKIQAGVVGISDAPPHASAILHRLRLSTPAAAPAAFYDAIAELICQLQARLAREGWAHRSIIGVAHPGRFLPDGRAARGTVPNLGEWPGQFDEICPAKELERRVGWRVVVENDAVAQMRSGLQWLLDDPAARPALLGQTVVYVGPGTGMGGGAARVAPDGAVTPITDGQLFDLQLVGYGEGRTTAEEVLTGPAIARQVAAANRQLAVPIHPANAEQVGRLLEDPHALPEHRTAARRIADQAGEMLGRIVALLHAGQVHKIRLERTEGGVVRHLDEPDRRWSEADCAVVRGVRRVVLGGSVGSNPILGAHLTRRALEWLAGQGLTGVQILQVPGVSADAGLLGAVLAIKVKVSDTFRAGKSV